MYFRSSPVPGHYRLLLRKMPNRLIHSVIAGEANLRLDVSDCDYGTQFIRLSIVPDPGGVVLESSTPYQARRDGSLSTSGFIRFLSGSYRPHHPSSLVPSFCRPLYPPSPDHHHGKSTSQCNFFLGNGHAAARITARLFS